MRLFQIVSTHRDEALEMFKADAPASRMVALRMENLSAMKSSTALSSTLPSMLQVLLVKSEEEAMALFQKEHVLGSMVDIGDSEQIDFGHAHHVGFGGEETNCIQDNIVTAEYKNDDLIEDGLSPHYDKSPGIASETDGSLDYGRSNQNLTQNAPVESLAIVDSASGRRQSRAPTKKMNAMNSKYQQVSFSPPATTAAGIIGQGSSTTQSAPRISRESLTIDPFARTSSSRRRAKKNSAKNISNNKQVVLCSSQATEDNEMSKPSKSGKFLDAESDDEAGKL